METHLQKCKQEYDEKQKQKADFRQQIKDAQVRTEGSTIITPTSVTKSVLPLIPIGTCRYANGEVYGTCVMFVEE